jgi:putative endonuclease
MVEQPAVNRRVAGSSPASGANSWLMCWVYILQNPAGKFYVGHTDDLQTRLHSHNRTDAIRGKFTRKNGPWELVWSEEHPTRAAAMSRERQIKGMKSARCIREELLNGRVPTPRD